MPTLRCASLVIQGETSSNVERFEGLKTAVLDVVLGKHNRMEGFWLHRTLQQSAIAQLN